MIIMSRPPGYETLDRNGAATGFGFERRIPTQPYTAHTGEVNECPLCHSVNDDTAQFCDQCGYAMHPISHVSNMQGIEDLTQACGCGKWNSADARYCGGCGRPLAGNGAASYGAYYARLSPDLEMRARRLRLLELQHTPDADLLMRTRMLELSA
jgi:predicted amidophosphoribosyltransferase